MKRFIPATGLMIFLLILWEVAVRLLALPEYLLPLPSTILGRAIEIHASLLVHAGYTAIEAGLGFVCGALLGMGLAGLFVRYQMLETSVYPYAIALKSVPIVAIAPLLVVWMGNGMAPKVVVAAIISFFPVVVNSVKGLRSIDPEAYDLFDSMSASRRQIFLKLRVPSALPYVFAALRISSTLAVIGAIVGEFSGADRGLGFFITVSAHRLETVDMFVGILMSSLLGIGYFYLVSFIEHRVVSWRREALTEEL
ncbi:MAG: ABC transporter permease [Opitutae bacterium]|nr:ABC transporter permease [Opitutae bacterium]